MGDPAKQSLLDPESDVEEHEKKVQHLQRQSPWVKQWLPSRRILAILFVLTVVVICIALFVKFNTDTKNSTEKGNNANLTSLRGMKLDVGILISTVHNLQENLTRLNRSANSTTRSLRDILEKTRGILVHIQNQLQIMNTSYRLKLHESSAALISTMETIKESIIKLNKASGSKMRRLQVILNNPKNALILIQSELMKLYESLNESTHVRDSTVSSIQNLRKDLTLLTNSTTATINKLWNTFNQTDDNVVKIFALVSHHNASFHTKLQKVSQISSEEVKNLDKKLIDVQNNTAKKFRQLQIDLENTRENLWKAHDRISGSNTRLHSALDELSTDLQNSVEKVTKKITSLRSDFETNKNDMDKQHKATDEKISGTKDSFQESERKLKKITSGLKTRITNAEDHLERTQGSLGSEISMLRKELKELRETVNKLKNGGYMTLQPNILIIAILTALAFSGLDLTRA